MKIRNFEYFAKRVAKTLNTSIVRFSEDNHVVWFDNYFNMVYDGEFIVISDVSEDRQYTVAACFIYQYDKQKDFLNNLQLCLEDYAKQKQLISNVDVKDFETETPDATGEEPTETETETSSIEEATEESRMPNGHVYIDTDSVKIEPLNPTRATIEIPYVDVDCNNLKKVQKNSLYGMFGESQDTERDRIKYIMDTYSLVPHVSINSHCMEIVLCMEEVLKERYGNTIAHKCKMYNNGYYVCPADRQGNRCCGEKWCAETWKRYEAIINPEWHHVSLNTLTNLDFDMLNEKRQTYLTVYRDLQETLSRLRKCKTIASYDKCYMYFMRRKNTMWAEGKISNEMWRFIEAKVSMQNVESGVWGSYNEEATGYHKSRRYNKSRA